MNAYLNCFSSVSKIDNKDTYRAMPKLFDGGGQRWAVSYPHTHALTHTHKHRYQNSINLPFLIILTVYYSEVPPVTGFITNHTNHRFPGTTYRPLPVYEHGWHEWQCGSQTSPPLHRLCTVEGSRDALSVRLSVSVVDMSLYMCQWFSVSLNESWSSPSPTHSQL